MICIQVPYPSFCRSEAVLRWTNGLTNEFICLLLYLLRFGWTNGLAEGGSLVRMRMRFQRDFRFFS